MKKFIGIFIMLLNSCLIIRGQTISPPNLVSPGNGSGNIAVGFLLDWTSVSSNQGYIYEVDITSSFNSSLKQSGFRSRNSSSYFVTDLFFGQTYYWRVATKSNVDTSVWSPVRSFTTIDEPVLTAPASNAANITPSITLDWSSMSGVQQYFYEVDTTLNFNSTLKVSGLTSGNGSLFAVSDLRFDKTYYWRIAAVNAVDTSSWSVVRSFITLSSIGLISPTNLSTNLDVEETIDWASVQGNNGYIYQIDSTVNFNSTLVRTLGTFGNTSQALVSNLRFGTTYYWRVAVKTVSDTSDWSTILNFTTTDQVTLYQPSNNAINQEISETISWSFVAGNNGYIYQHDTVASFDSPLLQQVSSTVNSSQSVLSNLRFGTTYYWRVAVKTTSDTSQWSSIFNFATLDQLTLFSPVNGAQSQSITETLDWRGITGNNGYIYQIDTGASFSSPAFVQNSFTANVSQVIVNNLRFGTTYYWRVAAKSTTDTSDWSSTFNFTTLDNVVLVSPTNNSTLFGVDIPLDWGTVSGNNGYIYEVDTVLSFNSLALRSTGSSANSSQSTVSNLLFGTTYYWRVAAKTLNDTSGWSQVRNFTTTDVTPLFSPNDNSTSRSLRQRLDWGNIYGNSGYIYELDTTVNFNSPYLFADTLIGSLSQVDAPLLRYGTKYYWRVRATTVIDTSAWSSIRSFTTVDVVSLSFPVNNAANLANSVNISWNSITSSSYYIYEVDESPFFITTNKIAGNTAGLTGLSLRRANLSNLQNGQDYYWRIAAVSAIDTGSFTASRKFSTAFLLPNAPALTSPANGATNVQRRQLVLDWGNVINATQYQFQLDTINSFSPISGISTVNSSQVNLSRRENFTTYHWRVRAKNNSGNSPWSPVWSFTTENCDNSDTLVVVNCGTYLYRGVLYSNSGFYQRVLLNTLGCDSTVYLDIIINRPSASRNSVVSCDSLALNGQTYFNSGNYTQVILNSKGCDSTINLNLTILNNSIAIQQNGFRLTSTQTNAAYQWLDCNNGKIAIAGETAQVFTAQQNGSYAVEISNGNCLDTSNCVLVNSVGLQHLNNESSEVKVYPNPTKDFVTVVLGSKAQKLVVEIFDLTGKLVQKKLFRNASEFTIRIYELKGMYLLKVIYDEKVEVKRVFRN